MKGKGVFSGVAASEGRSSGDLTFRILQRGVSGDAERDAESAYVWRNMGSRSKDVWLSMA